MLEQARQRTTALLSRLRDEGIDTAIIPHEQRRCSLLDPRAGHRGSAEMLILVRHLGVTDPR